MEVIRENFEELFPEIKAAIESCSFMAIDTELTGLYISETKENQFDTMEERYQFIKEASTKFLVIQFGLVTFFYNEEEEVFTHKAYNFYTYPSQTKNFMPTIRFMCESSAMEFLSSFGFDFNKLFHHGIPYLSNSLKNKVIEQHEEREAKFENEKVTTFSVPEQFKKFMDETKSVIKRFEASSKEEHLIDNLSPFQRRLVFENLKPKYPNLLFETVQNDEEESDSSFSASEGEEDNVGGSKKKKATTNILSTPKRNQSPPDNSLPKSMADLSLPTTVKKKPYKKPLRVTKVSEEQLKQRKEEKKLKFEKDVDSMFGFSKVIQEIRKSGKVVCGHNMLLDICRTVHQFVDDLPDTLSDFKSLVQTSFPNLIDTKVMASQLPFREFFNNSVLPDILKRLETEPFSLADCRVHQGDMSKGYGLSQGKFHEAGYDAYITGLCFITMCKYLGTLQNPQKTCVLPDSPLVLPYINKLYMMRMMDICYINISGTDLTPSKSHVFYVQCPQGTSVDTIRNWFSPFGQIYYHRIGEGTLLVSLMDKDQAPLVIRNIDKLKGFSITTFEKYTELKKRNKPASSGSDPSSPRIDSDTSSSGNDTSVKQSKRAKTEKDESKKKTSAKAPVEVPVLFEQPAWD